MLSPTEYDMTIANKMEAEWQCSKATLAFFRYLDERKYDDLVALTTPDCLWIRNGEELKGPEQIRTALDARSPTMHIHHIITNLEVEAADDESVAMRAYLLSYRHDDGRPLTGPAPLDKPRAIFISHGVLRPVDGRWKLSYLTNGQPSFLAMPEAK